MVETGIVYIHVWLNNGVQVDYVHKYVCWSVGLAKIFVPKSTSISNGKCHLKCKYIVIYDWKVFIQIVFFSFKMLIENIWNVAHTNITYIYIFNMWCVCYKNWIIKNYNFFLSLLPFINEWWSKKLSRVNRDRIGKKNMFFLSSKSYPFLYFLIY